MTLRFPLLLLLLAGCAGRVGYESPAPMAPDARFGRFLQEVRLARLDRDPTLRRLEGLPPLSAFPVLSAEEREEERALSQRELDRLTAFSPAVLSAANRLEHRLLTLRLEAHLEQLDWLDHAPLTLPGEGVLAELDVRLLDPDRWETEQDLLAWVDQVRAGAAWMLAASEELRDRERRGLLPPRRGLVLATAEAARRTGEGAGAGAFLARLQQGLADLAPSIEPRRLDDLRRRAVSALEEDLAPGLTDWHATLEDLAERSSGDAGAWSRPEGDAWYAHLLRQGTSLPLSANALHQLALEEVQRIQAAVRTRLAQVDHPGSVASFLELLRTDERFRLTDAAASEHVARTVEEVTARLGTFVADPPALAPLELTAPDGLSAPSLFAWTIENGLPGRALREQWNAVVPGLAPRRPVPAWQQGWDVYVNAVVLDLAWSEDPYEQVALLDRELWRAALLVADTGLHDQRWSPDQAVDYLERTTATARERVAAAVDELLLRPGSAAPAVVGNIRLQELQRRSRDRLDDRFELGRFHRLLLGLGPLPMNVLEEQVAAWGTRTLRDPGQ